MITIRDGFFETNSSNTHALILNRKAEGALPKIIDLSEDDSTGDYIRKIVRCLHNEDVEKLINWLYSKGVEEIKYNGRNTYVNECIDKYKNNYKDDLGIPSIDWQYKVNEGALINLLIGEYEEYNGHDSYLSDYDNHHTVPVEI